MSSAAESAQQPYPAQEYQAEQQYGYQYPQPAEPGAFLTKKVIFLLMAIGLGVLWIGVLLPVFGDTATFRDIGWLFRSMGGIFVAIVAVAGALGSKRTTDFQNLGLLLFAGLVLWISVPT